MPFKYTDEELVYTLSSLTDKQRKAIGNKLRPDVIDRMFENIKATVAAETKQRVQSKIATTFVRGYSNGSLLNSIYTQVEGDQVVVKSTKSYFAILNKGIDSYDMKEKLAGKTVRMRLPGGKVIFRKVPTSDAPMQKSKKKTKTLNKTGGWIYPGYAGVHIFETVAKEMETWTRSFIRNQIQELIQAAGVKDFNVPRAEVRSYNRGADGRFIKKTSSYSTIFKDDLSTFGYQKLQNGSIIPKPRKQK